MLKQKQKQKTKLVIVGGGFAGISVAKNILKRKSSNFEITLIDKNDYHFFYPAVFSVISSSASLEQFFSSLLIKFENIFKKGGVKILKNEVTSVSSDNNFVVLKNGSQKIEYDYLVLATGMVSQNIGLDVMNLNNVLEIKKKIKEIFNNKAKRNNLNISVVGAGITGCELVVVLNSYAKKLAKKYGHPLETINLKLYESREKILLKHSVWLREKIQNYLEQEGIEIELNKQFDKNDELNTDLVVWALGAKDSNLTKDAKINNKLQLKTAKNIFVARGHVIQSAVHQGEHVANSLASLINKKTPNKYKQKKDVHIIQLGGKYYADLGFVKFGGVLAKTIKQLAFLRYFTKTISLKFALKWLKTYKSL
ncbi:MAG: FAD-dependent oxidoreductase [Candidatus Marinimicrobia bacterium]|nr:FAD-dependent oxidoreductase [Candidatus Neomarinimicrobiota bacterium]